jgi:hypothetical protein
MIDYDILTLHYPDRPRDAETLMVDPWTADLYVVTKYTQPTEVYRAGYPQTAEMTMELVASFTADWGDPLDKDFVGPTGGDIAADGRQILIRGYGKAYLWTIHESNRPLWEVFQETPTEVPLGWEDQGEAIAFTSDSQGYYSTSEGPWRALYHYSRPGPCLIGPPDVHSDGIVNFIDFAELLTQTISAGEARGDQAWDGLRKIADYWLQITNHAPSDISPSAIIVGQNTPAASTIGHFQAHDPDVRDLHRYHLTSGVGDDDNALFEFQENRLVALRSLDRPILDHYAIRAKCSDRMGLSLAIPLRVEVGYDPYLIQTDFSDGPEGFVYLDDTFRETTQPGYAWGQWQILDGDLNRALYVCLGGIDNENIDGLSGGWRCRFNVPADTSHQWMLSFSYRLQTHERYSKSEYTEVLATLDGALVPGPLGAEAIDRLNGGGNTGWRSVRLSLGGLADGEHDLILGLYNNRKTHTDEVSELFIGNVRIFPVGFES